jgi:hypothetical protein
MDRQGAKHAKEGSEPRRILPLRPLRSRGFIHSRQVWLAKVLLRRQSLRQKSRARPGRLNSHLDVGRLGAPGSMIVRARTSLQKMVKWAAVK